VLKLLGEGELNLNIFSGFVRRRDERPFANGFFSGVGEDFASSNSFDIGDFSSGVDDGLDHDDSFDFQMPGEFGVKGRYAAFDGSDAFCSHVQSEGGE